FMDSREKTKEIIKKILVEKGADFVALFGSFARGEEKSTSDIDILVNFKNPISLFDHAGIELELEEKTGKKVDLVTERGLSKYIRPFIMNDIFTLYERR
ncbi:MAG: nucleotidyltransferase family protein, partial [Patescibacteria group bacterium]